MGTIELTNKKRTLIFINIVISCIASSMLATALTTALPPITKDFGISTTTAQWLTSGYSLTMAIVMPLSAFIVNRFPTKKLYPTAISIFILGTAISASAVNFPMMMVGRVIQATGGGTLTSMAQVIILSIYPAEKKGTAMGWYGLSIGAAPVIAPTIAGIIVDNASWRWIFLLVMSIMIISLIYAIFVFEDVLPTKKSRFDILSFIISACAFGGITLGIGNIGSYSFVSIEVLLPLIVGVITAAIFIYRQLHIEVPFLELRVFKSPEYTFSVLGSMLLYFVIMGSTIILPLYIQQTLGLSATTSGLMILPGSLASAVLSPFVGKIYDKIGIKPLFISGAICVTLSSVLMCFININTGIWVASVLNVIRNIACACLLMPLVTWGTKYVKFEYTSHATALITSLRTIFGALGSAVCVAVMTVATNKGLEKYGEEASMHGVNMAFLAMTIAGLLLLVVSLLPSRRKKF